MSPLCFSLLPLSLTAAVPADTAAEQAELNAWFARAFLGDPSPVPPPVGIEVKRQDHGEMKLRRCILGTPLRIGTVDYQHGLGSHSTSEFVVRLPQPGRRFTAAAGVDNNYDTAGQRGSVTFHVEVGGQEAWRSGVHRGGQAPLAVDVALNGAREFVLRIGDGGDGPGWDQSDWADAQVELADGTKLWLDELPVTAAGTGPTTALPFSLQYGGKPLSELIGGWPRRHTQQAVETGTVRHELVFTDPAGGLEITCQAIVYGDLPAVEWVLHLRHPGAGDSELIEAVRPLDLPVVAPPTGEVTLHHSRGSTCSPTDFLPLTSPVPLGAKHHLAPNGGRSSDGVLPFFNLSWAGGGLVGAVGWSGQWALDLVRGQGREMRLSAGQQTTHFRLHSGESVRTPRILLGWWRGADPLRGHNLCRRTMLRHYVPRTADGPVPAPVTMNTWFVYNSGNDVTEANQLACQKTMAELGVEGYWLDAGWFEGGWPNGVGSWLPKKEAFPRGLRPVGDAAHQRGMTFVLWFEPERVHPASRIGREHPEWVLRMGEGDGLFNLGDPAARAWLADHLSQRLADWGVDIYRNDFNIAPLPFWQKADAPDRQGIAEIRYVEGLYWLWDELRRRQPGLQIDNCASGGRRIDLETCTRSIPLWRSDSQCCGHAEPVWDQVQTAGLSLYVPLHSAGVWGFDAYTWRSVATTGASLCLDTRAGTFDVAQAKQMIAQTKADRPYWCGDYYPLVDINGDRRQWCGWQFHRPDLKAGLAVLFRRDQSPYKVLDLALREIDPAAAYDLEFVDANRSEVLSGSQLAHLAIEIPTAPGSVMLRYRQR